MRARGLTPGTAQPAQKLHGGILRCRVGTLENAGATRDRGTVAANRSTKPATPRMKWSNNKPIMIEVPLARIPEEPGAVIPHAGICEGGASGNRRPYLNRQKNSQPRFSHVRNGINYRE